MIKELVVQLLVQFSVVSLWVYLTIHWYYSMDEASEYEGSEAIGPCILMCFISCLAVLGLVHIAYI